MPGRLAFLLALGLWLVWAGGAWAQSPAPPGTDVARSLIAGDLSVLDPTSASRFGIVEIASGSMQPTLQVDDRVVYDRAAYGTALPARGEVVIFRPPPSAVRTCGATGLFVHRVVATAGDVVRTTGRSVIVNGVALQISGGRPPRAVRGFRPVPVGRVLVVGDNGPSSCDSVQWRTPFLPVSYLVGRADGIVWPRDRAGLLPCAGAPIRTLLRALGLDFRATSGRRVGIRRLAQRLRVHHGVALTAIAACWDPLSPGTPLLG